MNLQRTHTLSCVDTQPSLMRVLVQRVTSGSVTVDGTLVSCECEAVHGFLGLVCVSSTSVLVTRCRCCHWHWQPGPPTSRWAGRRSSAPQPSARAWCVWYVWTLPTEACVMVSCDGVSAGVSPRQLAQLELGSWLTPKVAFHASCFHPTTDEHLC